MEAVGGKLHGLWYAFGDHDGYVLTEGPDNTSVASVLVTVAGSAAFRSVSTTVLLTVEELLSGSQGRAGSRWDAQLQHPLTFDHSCGSMLDAAAQRGCRQPDRRRQASSKHPKEVAMRIGEQQEEFEILPTEQEQQPVVLPEREPQPQPEHAPA